MDLNQLEFAISQYLDGDLPAQERAALEQVLASDPEARRIFDEHLALDKALKSAGAIPAVQWNQFAANIADAAAQQHAELESAVGESNIPDEFELAIMQYVDGEFPADERAALEKRLEANPAARQVLAEHRALDTVLKNTDPLPHVDFDRLAEHLSETVAEEVAPSSYSISAWRKYASAVAIAAMVLIVAALAIHFALRGGNPLPNPGGSKQVVQVAIGPDAPAGKSELSIAIVPSDDLYDSGGLVASAKPRIEIDETVPVVNDGGFSFP